MIDLSNIPVLEWMDVCRGALLICATIVCWLGLTCCEGYQRQRRIEDLEGAAVVLTRQITALEAAMARQGRQLEHMAHG